MSKKTEKRSHQEENLEHIESALTSTEVFLEKYQKQLVYGVGAVVLVIALFMLYKTKVAAPKEVAAQNELFPGEVYFEKDSFQLALNGDGSYLGFIDIADEYSGTKAGNLANYYAGVSYMHLGQYEDAIEYLKSFKPVGDQLAPVAIGALGDCYLETEETAKAIDCYTKAAAYANNFTTPIHLQKLGTAYELNGNGAKAVETYEKIKSDYPSSAEAREIDKYIARAKAL